MATALVHPASAEMADEAAVNLQTEIKTEPPDAENNELTIKAEISDHEQTETEGLDMHTEGLDMEVNAAYEADSVHSDQSEAACSDSVNSDTQCEQQKNSLSGEAACSDSVNSDTQCELQKNSLSGVHESFSCSVAPSIDEDLFDASSVNGTEKENEDDNDLVSVKIEPAEYEEITCELCDEKFDDSELYKEHVKTHTNKVNKCDVCAETFTTITNLKSHYYSVHDLTLPPREKENRRKTKSPRAKKKEIKQFTCDICNETFRKELAYQQHLSNHKGGSEVICKICKKSFASVKLRDEHMTEHDDALDCMTCGKSFTLEGKEKYLSHLKSHRKKHICSICGLGFTGPSKLQLHIASHTGHKPKTVICSYCGKGFWNKKLYRRHLAVHGVGHELCKCEICGKEVYSRMRFRAHMAIHKPKTLACTLCGKLFRNKRDVLVHQRTHTGERPYHCELCGKSFANVGAFKTHKNMHEGKMMSCVICKKGFTLKSSLAKHLATHARKMTKNSEMLLLDQTNEDANSDGGIGDLDLLSDCSIDQTEHKCNFCDIFFESETGLKVHYLKHAAIFVKEKVKDEHLHTCHFCGKVYKSKGSLNRHLRSHTGDNLHFCPECEEGFSTANLMKRHLVKVHKINKDLPHPVNCELCGKTFQWPWNLKQHLTTHTDHRPFQCSVCGKQFRQKPHLDTHMRIHTGERPFQCTQCGNCFAALSTLRNHIRNIHSEHSKPNARRGRPRKNLV